jgi:hypothetical protein
MNIVFQLNKRKRKLMTLFNNLKGILFTNNYKIH